MDINNKRNSIIITIFCYHYYNKKSSLLWLLKNIIRDFAGNFPLGTDADEPTSTCSYGTDGIDGFMCGGLKPY